MLLHRRDDKLISRYFHLAFAKRPAEELFDLTRDPAQLTNVSDQPRYAAHKRRLRSELDRWMVKTGDPRATSDDDRWDRFRYFGGKNPMPVRQ